jgi:hypothetical protein
LRESINQRYDNEGQVEKIVKALKKAEEEALNVAPARGEIKRKNEKLKEGRALKNTLELRGRGPSKTQRPKTTT